MLNTNSVLYFIICNRNCYALFTYLLFNYFKCEIIILNVINCVEVIKTLIGTVKKSVVDSLVL